MAAIPPGQDYTEIGLLRKIVDNQSSSQPVSGTVAVSNFPATQPVSGAVSVSNLPATQSVSGSVSVSNLPATQPVSGAVSVSNLPATQSVSGTVAVSNLPATQPVSGTVGVNNFPSNQPISYTDTASLDAFSRLRVANPEGLFEGQFTYSLLPLQYGQLTTGSGAAIAHDATNRCVTLTFASTPTGGRAAMQSFEYIRYQPGKGQLSFTTFNFIAAVANTLKFAGLSDGVNGIEFQNNGTQNQIVIYSGTANGNQTVAQSAWNLDKLDGTGASGITLDITKTQILVIDFQALYVGRVRVGFDIGGRIYYVHQFFHANLIATPYFQYATLPVRCGMTCTGTVSTTMRLICASVISEGGQEDTGAVPLSAAALSVTAASGTDTHAISIRPKTTFNGIVNRVAFGLTEVNISVSGNFPVYWQIVIGQAITGASYADVNATYSAFEASTAGTVSGSPSLVLASGVVAVSATAKSSGGGKFNAKVPISLDAAGAVRANGTLTVLVRGLGGASACYVVANWVEIK